jgi:sulfur carrier protein ThiS adenylyltransferase
MLMKINNKKRYERQSDIFSGRGLVIAIIGVGAVGRQIALQLSAMGVEKLVLIDFDTVEDVNLSAQGFRESDLGKSKVDAVAEACLELNRNTKIKKHEDILREEYLIQELTHIFCCVDNMATRKQIIEMANTPVFDSRMGARVCSVKSVFDEESYDYYMDNLFDDDEMVQESCTAKTTLFCANVCAGLMIAQMVKLQRGEHIYRDIVFDLSAMTYFILKPSESADTLEQMTEA